MNHSFVAPRAAAARNQKYAVWYVLNAVGSGAYGALYSPLSHSQKRLQTFS